MKRRIAMMTTAGTFLVGVSCDHLSLENQNDHDFRYQKKYPRNLKNPLIQCYREHSCEASKAMLKQGGKNEEKKWNYYH